MFSLMLRHGQSGRRGAPATIKKNRTFTMLQTRTGARDAAGPFVRVAAEVYGMTGDGRVYQAMTIAFDFSAEEIWVPWAAGAILVPRPGGTNLIGDGAIVNAGSFVMKGEHIPPHARWQANPAAGMPDHEGRRPPAHQPATHELSA